MGFYGEVGRFKKRVWAMCKKEKKMRAIIREKRNWLFLRAIDGVQGHALYHVLNYVRESVCTVKCTLYNDLYKQNECTWSIALNRMWYHVHHGLVHG